MSKSQAVRYDDVRAMLRMVGELTELPPDRRQRGEHFLSRLCELLGAQVAFINEASNFRAGLELKLEYCLMSGEIDPNGLETLSQSGTPASRMGPALQKLAEHGPARTTRLRQQLARDHTWYNSEFFNERYRVARLEHCLFSLYPLRHRDRVFAVGAHRGEGTQPFRERERRLLEILNLELGWFFRSVAIESASTVLSRRLQATLERLLAGDSEKQVAWRLGLSRHTIHGYVKEIYKHFGVSSRGELLAKLLRASGEGGDSCPHNTKNGSIVRPRQAASR